jgi:hypothetical protein
MQSMKLFQLRNSGSRDGHSTCACVDTCQLGRVNPQNPKLACFCCSSSVCRLPGPWASSHVRLPGSCAFRTARMKTILSCDGLGKWADSPIGGFLGWPTFRQGGPSSAEAAPCTRQRHACATACSIGNIRYRMLTIPIHRGA